MLQGQAKNSICRILDKVFNLQFRTRHSNLASMDKTIQTPNAGKTEWQTWLLILFVYVSWLTLVSHYHTLPGAVILLVITNALHGSMQHELIHGHPTRYSWFNALLAYPPLSLWYPYPLYGESHIVHHQDENITLPGLDPESFYVSQHNWENIGPIHRKLLIFNMTLAGRFLIGPALTLNQLIRQVYVAFKSRNRLAMKTWLIHFVLLFVLLYGLNKFAYISTWQYFLIAYASQSLAMLRSFFEHRAVPEKDQRTVLVEASLPMRLLFTNNNYHLVHHEQPEMAWYLLPDIYRKQRKKLAKKNGGFVVKGYRQWWTNNLFKPIDHPRHPFHQISKS